MIALEHLETIAHIDFEKEKVIVETEQKIAIV
jgi:hypothetical protein